MKGESSTWISEVCFNKRKTVCIFIAEKKNKKVHTHMVYGFGPLEKALETMYEMRGDFEIFSL